MWKRLIHLVSFFLVIVIALTASCKKDYDYRDQFTGTYYCEYMMISRTIDIVGDTAIFDTLCNSNVPFTVTKSEHPNKLTILGTDVVVNTDGSLEHTYDPIWYRWYIEGKFISGDTIHIKRFDGKLSWIVQYWDGRK